MAIFQSKTISSNVRSVGIVFTNQARRATVFFVQAKQNGRTRNIINRVPRLFHRHHNWRATAAATLGLQFVFYLLSAINGINSWWALFSLLLWLIVFNGFCLPSPASVASTDRTIIRATEQCTIESGMCWLVLRVCVLVRVGVRSATEVGLKRMKKLLPSLNNNKQFTTFEHSQKFFGHL